MEKRPILLIPALLFVLLYLLYPLVEILPGGGIVWYLLGVASCLLVIGFSSGWPKYIGIALCLLFLFFAGYEADARTKLAKCLYESELKQLKQEYEKQNYE